MCLEHYSPFSDDINAFLLSGTVSMAGILIAMLITSKLYSSKATGIICRPFTKNDAAYESNEKISNKYNFYHPLALQLEQEILAFANRQLEAVRDRLIAQADGTFRPP